MKLKKRELRAINEKAKNKKPTFSSDRKRWFFKIELPKIR